MAININFNMNITEMIKRGTSPSLVLNFQEADSSSQVVFQASLVEGAEGDYREFLEDFSANHTVVDLYPLNATGKSSKSKFLKGAIGREDFENLSKIHSIANRCNGVCVFVLDVQDKNNTYADRTNIQAWENQIAECLKGAPQKSSFREKVNKLMKTMNIKYMFKEGTLKSDLLSLMSPSQREFFESEEQGKEQLCQLVEIVMNFFKLGYSVEVRDETFSGSQYLQKINDVAIEQSDQSGESLVTFYPPHYLDTYSKGGGYYEVCSKVLIPEHEVIDQVTKITLRTN